MWVTGANVEEGLACRCAAVNAAGCYLLIPASLRKHTCLDGCLSWGM